MRDALPIPCLHRVYSGSASGVQNVYRSLGLSIAADVLLERLARLDHRARMLGHAPRSAFVTFDDGWSDVLLVAPMIASMTHLQPVLFVMARHLAGDLSPLPLPRLYEWCHATGRDPKDPQQAGISRPRLKQHDESRQHAILDRLGIPYTRQDDDLLTLEQIRDLISQDWLVGSHGHDHYDLRHASPESLMRPLRKTAMAIKRFGGRAWLAWPEGGCTNHLCEVAELAGFELQFSLRQEAVGVTHAAVRHREIWK